MALRPHQKQGATGCGKGKSHTAGVGRTAGEEKAHSAFPGRLTILELEQLELAPGEAGRRESGPVAAQEGEGDSLLQGEHTGETEPGDRSQT